MVAINQFPGGMNNKQPSHALPEGTVRNIVNADVDDLGFIRRRRGVTKVLSCIDSKDGYNCPLGSYFIDGIALKKFNGEDEPTTLYTGINGTEFSWEYFNGVLYFSDNLVGLKITAVGVTQWGINIPDATMTIASISGTFGGGVYRATCTYVDGNGVESGAADIVELECADDTGILFLNIPSSSDTQVEKVRLYLSQPNGSTLFHVADVTNGVGTYQILTGRYDNSKILETAFTSKPPAGRIIRERNGRLFICSGSVVWYTNEYSPDHVNLADNYLQYPGEITVFEPCGSVIFVVADQTYLLSGDHGSFTQVPILPYGAVYGTGKKIPNSEKVAWYSERGLVIGGPDGSIANAQEANVAPDGGDRGTLFVRETGGTQQAIASIKNASISPLAATSFIDAEIIRRA